MLSFTDFLRDTAAKGELANIVFEQRLFDDLMIDRVTVAQVVATAEQQGFRHSGGMDMLLYGETNSARNAVHLLLSNETVKSTQLVANPALSSEWKSIAGVRVSVLPFPVLLRMKLSSYRLKDQVHAQVMDAAGLITASIETALSPVLLARLQHVHATD